MAMGMLDDIEQFDAALFGIAPREARVMDPQQRLTLQGTWHALEHANIDPMSLRGSRTGVFIGVADNDYMPLLLREKTDVVPDMAYLGTGNKVNVIAGRVSYVFGLEGPSMAIDTACSSSAVAIHLACRSLRDAECDLAVAGGVNLVLDPYSYTLACRARMLAADGRCKSFDQRADGFVRAEGCGMLVLKRLSDAQRDADRIVAVVRGSAVNQDGRSSSLTAPNPQAQQRLIHEALAAAGADPGSIGYVEAHGTGTQLGDPIELRALNAVFGASPRTAPLLVGTAKSLIGHAEAAAGVAGVIKLALSLQTGVLPANRHFGALNAEAAEVAASIAVVDRNRPWPAEARLGGVSSFGFSGTNAHLVLEVPPARENTVTEALPVLCIGAADAERVEQLVLRWREVLAGADAAAFTALCAASRHGRWAGVRRLALAAADLADAQRQLENRQFVYEGDASARVVLRLDVPAATAIPDGALAVEQARLAADVGVAADDTDVRAFLSSVALCNRLQALGVVVSIWQCGSAPREALAVAAGVLAPRDAVRLLRGETLQSSAFSPARSVCLDRQGRDISSEIAQAAFWQRPDAVATDLAAISGTCPLDELSVAWHRGDTDVMRDAHLLAAAFARGFTLDWQDAAAARADAPLYPFARVRHWPHSQWPLVPVRPARAASAASHYLLGERRRLPRSNEIRFSRRFSASSPAYVNHHRLLDTAVVPAASHLSMVLSAWRAQGGDWPCTIEDLNLLHPLVLQDEGARDVELILRRDGDRFAVELVSCDVSAVNDESAWVTHMRCTLRGGAAPTSPPVSAETVRSTWQPTIAHDAFYRRFWEHGYTLGSSFRWLGDGWIDAGCTVRRMRTPELPDAVQDFDLYPGLIDGCFSVLSSGQLAWMQQLDEGHIVIPVSIERVEFHGWKTPHGECWTHAATAGHAVSDGERARENICLFEPDGHVVARIVGFETRRAQRDALRLGYREPVRDWLYRVVWQEQSAPPPAQRSAPLWLIDGGGALADALAVAVADRLVQRTALDALDGAASPASSVLDIVWLMPEATAGDLALQRLLTLWQRLSGAALRLRLSVVTQHGVQVTSDDSLLPASCALWGLVRGIAAEHPEAELRLCDIGATDTPALQLDAVLRGIDADGRETQCAWRAGHRHVARLERHRRQRGYPDLDVRADARYIVTGGLGGIGAAAVRWLIEAGAGCVQVVARRTVDGTWHELQNVARAHRTRLELVIADLADEPIPATLWDAPEPVAGILHLAGVVDDAAVLRTSAAQLSRILLAKWRVGEQLAALALRTRPDFVVFFGSLAATLPAQGQAAYAAANAALEALAARLRGEGVAATCVGFGPWAAVGMSARLGSDYERRLVESGLNPLRADQGLHVLGQLVQDGHAALIAASVQWSRFLDRRSEYATSPLLDAFAGERPSAGARGDTTAGDLRRVLEALPSGQRAARLADALRQVIAAVLGLADGGQVGRQQRLFDLGLDSMAAMDLREVLQRRLDLRLRATVLFDYPTVDALGGFVLDELFGASPAVQEPATAARFSAEQVAALSDEEAEALLLAEMKE
jgi:acyl transferase domain-containing protein/aryl carrier-like protein